MRFFSFIILIISILSVGCTAHLPAFFYIRHASSAQEPIRIIPVLIDVQFGQSDLIHIDDALNEWNYALNGQIVFKVVSERFDMRPSDIEWTAEHKGLMIMKVYSTNSIVPNSTVPGAKVSAFSEINGTKMFLVRDRLNDENMKAIVAHELGHILGTRHMTGKTLMTDTYSKEYNQCIDERTIKAVAFHNHLEFSKLNYCIYE